ncbi:DUF6099 family protein [Kitasatospora saccharophila]|uniref:DUF6099 family protein n=1 Tax=Kitasatospora saccharophila TaxID=407973 RepID=UPI0036315D0E
MLSEAGAHTASCLRQPPEPGLDELPGGPVGVYPEWNGPTLVERFSALGELDPVLAELALLLEEANESLVVLACGADTESLYWSCIDGLDAGSECRDLVAELLREQRRLTGARAPDGEPGAAQERGGERGGGRDGDRGRDRPGRRCRARPGGRSRGSWSRWARRSRRCAVLSCGASRPPGCPVRRGRARSAGRSRVRPGRC